MMMAKRRKGLSERHKKILQVLEKHQAESGYPPSIREIGKQTGISSTSVVNYYLNQLEEEGYIERDRKISRGVRLVEDFSGQLHEAAGAVRQVIEDLIRVPVIGRIQAGQPMPVPGSDFGYYDPDSGGEIARSLISPGH